MPGITQVDDQVDHPEPFINRKLDTLSDSYQTTKQIPESLAAVGIDERGPNGLTMSVDPKNMVLTVESARGTLIFTPRADKQGRIFWVCSAGSEMRPAQLPTSCK